MSPEAKRKPIFSPQFAVFNSKNLPDAHGKPACCRCTCQPEKPAVAFGHSVSFTLYAHISVTQDDHSHITYAGKTQSVYNMLLVTWSIWEI